ncbi:B-cell receptor CD22-like [Hoplias malabaricus]|uniref:B-cell receptor CD22-like n=1 Tax=Hoplias malabaricus TaxID=27720 RepID=UPI003462C0BC
MRSQDPTHCTWLMFPFQELYSCIWSYFMFYTSSRSEIVLRVALSLEGFSVTLPQSVEEVDGTNKVVFDSSGTVNKLQGVLIGDISKKNCTTIFNSVSERDTGTYYFKIDGGVKFTFAESPLSINVTASPPKPTLTLYGEQMEEQNQRKEVLEGSSPPTLTWRPLQNNSSQEQNQNSSFVSSHLNFTVTRLHHGLNAPWKTSISVSPSGSVMWGSSVSLSCSSDGNPAVNYTWFRENGEQIETGPTFSITETNDTHSGLYYCRAQNKHGSQNSSVQLEVQCEYNFIISPQFLTSPSHCNSSDNDAVMMVCLCEVRGRPVPKLEWRLNEQPVSQSGSLSIKEESVGVSGLRSILSMHRSHLSMSSPHLQCVSTNQLGSSTLLFNFVGRCSNSVASLPLEGFSVTLPQSVEGVSGHCVLIPCSFTVSSRYEQELKNSPNVVWYKGGYETENVVFDSSKKVNKLQGELIGDTSKKNCTTIFNSVSERDNGMYYFRIEGRVKYTFREPPLSINITASPPKPTLTLYGEQMEEQNQRKEVLEGSSVSLFCSAFSLCTSQPPTLTWRPLQNNSSQEQNQNSSFVSSHLNFTVTRLHHGLSINCTATYQLKNKEIKKTRKNSLTLRVLYAPGDKSVSVSPSGPVMWGSSVSLSCSSDGNPAVNYTWFRENGEQIETGPTFNITETNDTHSGLYYCRAQNKYGSQNSSVQLDVQCE